MRSSIDRVFDLIEALAAKPVGANLNELASAAHLSKPTAHRLLGDLAQRGLARQDEASGTYSLTLELAMLTFRHLANVGFLDVCQPELDRLAAQSGELIRLAWRDGDRLVLVGEAQGAKPGLRVDSNLGRPVVLHTMAAGKVFLAQLPRETVLQLVRGQSLLGDERNGPRAITSEDELEAELKRVAKAGYAIAFDESDVGTAAIAVPILSDGHFLGSVAIVGPTVRWTRKRLAELAPTLQEVAESIGQKAAIAPFCRRTERDVARLSRA